MITCTFEHGHTASLRHVTIDALIIQNDKVLLVKRAEKLVEGGKWALPGGYMDRDETSRETALREVTEETGYHAINATFFGLIDTPKRRNVSRQDVDIVYTVEVGDILHKPDHEVTDMQWFDLDHLPDASEIAFDHQHIITQYQVRKSSKMSDVPFI